MSEADARELAAEALAAAKGLDEAAFEGALAVHRLRTLGEWSGLARAWPVFCSRRLGQPFEFCSALVDNARRVERVAALAKHPLPDDPRLLWGLGALGAAVERAGRAKFESLFGSAVGTMARAALLGEALLAAR